MKNFEPVKHKDGWAVFDKRNCSYEMCVSKKAATIKANELNCLDRQQKKENGGQ